MVDFKVSDDKGAIALHLFIDGRGDVLIRDKDNEILFWMEKMSGKITRCGLHERLYGDKE